METAKHLIGIAVQASMFLIIMAVAMASHWPSVAEHIRKPTLLLKALAAVNLVVPVAAMLVVGLFPLDQPVARGLMLMAVSPLAPLVPGNAYKAGARRSGILAIYLVIITLSILLVPLTVAVLNAVFGAHASAPIALVAKVAFVSGALPILIGLVLAALMPAVAPRIAPWISRVAMLMLALIVLLALPTLARAFATLIGNGAILACGLVVLAGVAAGHLLGAPDREEQAELSMAAAIRHPGIAAAIGHASGADAKTIAATILFLLTGVVVTGAYRAWLGRTAMPPPSHPIG